MVDNKIHALVNKNINEFRGCFEEYPRKEVQSAIHGEILKYANNHFGKIGKAAKRHKAFFQQIEADTGVPRKTNSSVRRGDGPRTLASYLDNIKDGSASLDYVFVIYYWFQVFAKSDEYAKRLDKTLLRDKKYTRGTSFEKFFNKKIPGKADIEAIRSPKNTGNDSNRELVEQSEPETETGQNPQKLKPPFQSRWFQTEEQVQHRLIEIQQRPFFGRLAAKKELNEFINDNNNGLMIVSAPAGSGKSALLANWLDELQASDEKVAYHFISNLHPLTTRTEAILGNLVEQIREIRGRDDVDIITNDAHLLREQLFTELINYPKNGKRLILILDGLDEAASIFEPFVEHTGLPKNIFVIVSARKDGDAFPDCLRNWKERLDRGMTGCFLNLLGLGEGDVKAWLQDAIGDLDIVESEELVTAILKTTDGLPLFLSFVIDDLEISFPTMANREEMLQLVKSMPAPFPKYIARQLGILAKGEDKILLKDVQRLFATLSRTLGPLHKSDLEAVLGKDCPNLEMLDHRVSRWLSIGQGLYSFTHPRLARAFAQVIGLNEDEVVESMVEVSKSARDAEDRLINWMEKAWKPQITRRGTQRGATYALDWLPEHLARLGTRGESDAVRLISDPAFLDERLRQNPKKASTRLTKNCNLWAVLPFEAKTFDGARQWTAFWAENETNLRLAAELPHPQKRPFADVVCNCLGDSVTSGSGQAPSGIALFYHPTPERGLIRSVDDALKERVSGVLPTPSGGYVSWGWDGAIHFWDKGGNLTTGGAPDAHKNSVNGVLPTPGDGYVSWGNDGAIHFWDKVGNVTTGGAHEAHRGRVRGVLLTPSGGYVSWGHDGAIHFWDKVGNLTTGGAHEAHKSWVNGVLPTPGGGYVSWCDDGAIRFWDKEGNATTGDVHDAHKNLVSGVLPTPEGGCVSWGDDGAIRFWDKEGNATIGNVQSAHRGWVKGVLPTPSGGYVSWGHDGAICFWDKEGSVTTGGAQDAHKNLVSGVLATPDDGYVSWGWDGAIHFWNKEGSVTTGGAQDAHERRVNDVFSTPDDGYISWGGDGAIRFWDETGMPLGTLVPPCGVNFIKIIENRLLVFGRNFWIYPLFNGLPWKENKDC